MSCALDLLDSVSVGLDDEEGQSIREARAIVAELIAAIEESRAATELFAQDGQPENYARFDASERRIQAALRRARGEA